MSARLWVRRIFDYLVDVPLLMYLLAVCGATLAILPDRGYTSAFVESSLPTMSSTAFALFGFMATALSILTTLKTTPFFESLQTSRRSDGSTMWRDLVGAFLHLMGIFAILGVFSMSVTKGRVLELPEGYYQTVILIYFTLVILAFLATIVAIYLLRLVANNPPPPKKKVSDQVTPVATKVTQEQKVIDIQRS